MTEVNNGATLEPIQATTQTIPAANTPQGKTFSEDYVHTIREEAKENRLARKAAEDANKANMAKFKTLLGLTEDDSLDDAKIAEYQNKQIAKEAAVMQKANAKLITAEIKSLDGYNSKLVEALLDKSKLVIGEDGVIDGLTEAVEALAVEYPEIKSQKAAPGVNPPPVGAKTADDEVADLKAQLRAHPGDSSIIQKIFLAKGRTKKEG